MRAHHLILTASLALAVVACGETGDAGVDAAETPATTETTAASDGAGLTLAQAQVTAVEALVASDTENCEMQDGVEREHEVVDLGDGVGAVIMECSRGMPDQWKQLFIIEEGGGHHMAVPLFQYDIQGDGEWRAEFAQPNLRWDAASRTFVSAIQGGDGCGSTTTWRWDAAEQRVAMLNATVQDCEGVTDEASLPEPRTIWPTTPPTSEPGTV